MNVCGRVVLAVIAMAILGSASQSSYAATIRGVVHFGKEPLPGATVTIRDSLGTTTRQTVTRADASFAFEDVVADSVVLTAELEGFWPDEIQVCVSRQTSLFVTFHLGSDFIGCYVCINMPGASAGGCAPPGLVEMKGTVVDEHDHPLPGALVTASVASLPYSSAVTDEAGGFALTVPGRTTAELLVTKEGYAAHKLRTGDGDLTIGLYKPCGGLMATEGNGENGERLDSSVLSVCSCLSLFFLPTGRRWCEKCGLAGCRCHAQSAIVNLEVPTVSRRSAAAHRRYATVNRRPSLQPASFPLQPASFPLHAASFPLHTSSFPVHAASFPLHTASFPLQTSSFPLQTSSFPLRTSSFPLQTSSFPLQTSSFPLQPGRMQR